MARNFGLLFSFAFWFFGAGSAWGQTQFPGYISDVEVEKDQRFYEVFLTAAPPATKTPLREVIFNQELSKEFKNKYREVFGQIDTESIVYQKTSFSALDENRGAVFSVAAKQETRKSFAEYMTRRLLEWHVDNYFKTDPSVRVVYELKETLSNVKVEVTPQTKVNLRYNLSDNTADLVVQNPYCDSRLTFQMDPKKLGPGEVLDERLVVEKQVAKKFRINTMSVMKDGRSQVDLIRSLKANWSVNFLTSVAYKQDVPTTRETRFLIGLGHSY